MSPSWGVLGIQIIVFFCNLNNLLKDRRKKRIIECKMKQWCWFGEIETEIFEIEFEKGKKSGEWVWDYERNDTQRSKDKKE